MHHLHRVALEKLGNNKGIRIRSCLSSVIFSFSSKINKNGSLSLFCKIESWEKIFISHLVCFWVPSEKIFTNTMMQGKKQSNAKMKRKVVHLGGRRPTIMTGRQCFVASQPWTNSMVAFLPLENVWWHWIMLYWSVSHGNDLKLLKFSIFEVFSCYPWLHFILSMITMC